MAPNLTMFYDGACLYKILKPIGTWGPNFNLTTYEAVMLNPDKPNEYTSASHHVALKMVDSTNGMDYIQMGIQEILKLNSLGYPPPHKILPIKKHFYGLLNGIETLCIVLPFDPQVSSLRSLMSFDPRFAGGLPQCFIATALDRALAGLHQIHRQQGRYHTQITAGNIFYHHQEPTIKLAFAASVYERNIENVPAGYDHEASSSSTSNLNPNPNQELDHESQCPINSMTDWARAPEVLKVENLYIYNTYSSDIWLIGIVALELAYGKIQVANREEMLNIARYISKKHRLPNTWEELRKKSAAEIKEKKSKKSGGIKKRLEVYAPENFINRSIEFLKSKNAEEKRFSESFVGMVAKCLATDTNKRPRADQLMEHDFFEKNLTDMAHFHNVVFKGFSDPVAQFIGKEKGFQVNIRRR